MTKKNQTVGIIAQARMGSSRLPGKVLMNLSGKPMLVHIIKRLKHCRNVDMIVIATSRLEQDMIVAETAQKHGVLGFIGKCDENDVLERYLQAAKEHAIDIIVRVTADCPIIDPHLIDELIDNFFKLDVDYVANCIQRTYPSGVDAEVFKTKALIKSSKLSYKIEEREHVVVPMRFNPDKFSIVNIAAEGKLKRPDLRLTVDTKEDFELIANIYEKLYKDNHVFLTEEIIDLMDANPELKKINAQIKQKTDLQK